MKWAKVPSKTGLRAWTPSRERPRAGVRSRRLLQPAGPKAVANGWQRGGAPLPARRWGCCFLPQPGAVYLRGPGSGGALGGAAEGGEAGRRGRGRQEASRSFFLKQVAVIVHYQSPTHSRLIGQETEASGCRIDQPKIPRALEHRTAFGTSPVLPGTIIFSNVFLPPKLRTADFGMQAKCRFASSQIDMILDARCCTGARTAGRQTPARCHVVAGAV